MYLKILLFLVFTTLLQTSHASGWKPAEKKAFISNCIKSANDTIDNYINSKNANDETIELLRYARKYNGDVCKCQQSELMKKWSVDELDKNINKIRDFIRTITSKNGKCYIGNFSGKQQRPD